MQKTPQKNSNWSIALLLTLLGGAYFYFRGGHETKVNEALQTTVSEHAEQIRSLENRITKLELRLASTQPRPPSPAPSMMATATPPKPVSNSAIKPGVPPQGRIVDVPTASSQSCEYATINSNTQLSNSLTWDVNNGGSFVGDLPKGTIVEIASSTLSLWNDYPNEHAVYVKVAEAPAARAMEGQRGYIELRRINHKKCNLGSEFEQ